MVYSRSRFTFAANLKATEKLQKQMFYYVNVE